MQPTPIPKSPLNLRSSSHSAYHTLLTKRENLMARLVAVSIGEFLLGFAFHCGGLECVVVTGRHPVTVSPPTWFKYSKETLKGSLSKLLAPVPSSPTPESDPYPSTSD
ncbi:hypothetical protein HYFRA_00003263 [Hymenoscyphus fraxineus]|uniref:Uncharacterized protein n=1 Tax=Hymenoscyphus fraxineus TaxID=746836 RepID=A0A9N9KUW0_9HELO|nr:hypothetical protein HYFRA_00003263 [Hymenoscyphus fraxineus]